MYTGTSLLQCDMVTPLLRASVNAAVCLSGNRFGMLGISRAEELAYKPLKAQTFAELMLQFKCAYESVGHRLTCITVQQHSCLEGCARGWWQVGLPVAHDVSSHQKICWRYSQMKVLASATARKLMCMCRFLRVRVWKALRGQRR